MPLILDMPPATDPVTLDEMKEHSRIDSVDEDSGIASLIRAATQKLDGRDGLLGRCLITQVWKLTLDRFAGEIVILLPPCEEIVSIVYVDPKGDEQTLAASEYQAFHLGTPDSARVRPAYGKSWPATRSVPEAVTVRFVAGYGDTAADVPEPLRTAIRMHVGHLYEHRESVMFGSGFVTDTPHGYDELISDYRMWSF